MQNFHGTTILAVRHKGKIALAGDGQVTLNNTVVKHRARKVRRIYNESILVGFAGATADALNLSENDISTVWQLLIGEVLFFILLGVIVWLRRRS